MILSPHFSTYSQSHRLTLGHQHRGSADAVQHSLPAERSWPWWPCISEVRGQWQRRSRRRCWLGDCLNWHFFVFVILLNVQQTIIRKSLTKMYVVMCFSRISKISQGKKKELSTTIISLVFFFVCNSDIDHSTECPLKYINSYMYLLFCELIFPVKCKKKTNFVRNQYLRISVFHQNCQMTKTNMENGLECVFFLTYTLIHSFIIHSLSIVTVLGVSRWHEIH